MKRLVSPADILTEQIRQSLSGIEPRDAVGPCWRVALVFAVQAYGQAQTANALRDLADLVEQDLMRALRRAMQ
jgi:hypothetical protein